MRNTLTLIGLVLFGMLGISAAIRYGQVVREGMIHDHVDHSTALAISVIPVAIISSIVILAVILIAIRRRPT